MSFKQATTVSSLKKFMHDLRQVGCKDTMVFLYSGAGDSGDIEPPSIDRVMQGTLDALGWRMEYATGGYAYDQATGKYIHTNDDHDACLLTLVSELLPGGWEINEGSSGEVVIDIVADTITVKHNQNVMDVEYSEETY